MVSKKESVELFGAKGRQEARGVIQYSLPADNKVEIHHVKIEVPKKMLDDAF